MKNILLLIVSVVVVILIAEGAAQIYVYKIAKRGKLFDVDKMTGWTVKPHLDMQRKNADGNIWSVKTNKDGFRRDSDWDLNKKRILILGDSFAFGEGVDVEDRFDAVIKNQGYSVLNTGVMGYGTDQQFLKAKPYLIKLNKDDIVIVLTYYNDFYDITRKHHSGRAKPWFTLKNRALQLHKTQITLKEILRDKSYIYAKLGSLIAKHNDTSNYDITHASKVYQTIIKNESQKLTERGIQIILAYHGIPVIEDTEHRNLILQTLNTLCESTEVECLNIDKHFNVDNDSNYFLADGHWNEKGHEVVGALLAEKLSGIVQQR